tara:strand:+ start:1017 stop:1328 length:312 start_codon:yes stop_codon:yes gene_type:complete
MEDKLKNIILAIQPEFESEDSWCNKYQLPNEVGLYLDTDEHLIQLNLIDDTLHISILINNDERYQVTEEGEIFIHDHLNKLLDNEIELTKRYYNEERYEQNKY